MRICEKHWTAMRKAIEERGMMFLVAQEGKEAAARLLAEAQGGEAPYDPLMSCNWMVTNRALAMGGLYLMTGDYCPICEVAKNMDGKPGDASGRLWSAEEIEQAWINGPADAALEHCKEHGLV